MYSIAAVPDATPVTIPDDEPTVATVGVVLIHTPPASKSVKVAVAPMQTNVGPPIGAGMGLTVTIAVTLQLPIAYLIVAVPADTPVTMPPTTEAIVPSLVVHVPPDGEELSVVVLAMQTVKVPVMEEGEVSTVTVAVV
jgi:hypothetical protein